MLSSSPISRAAKLRICGAVLIAPLCLYFALLSFSGQSTVAGFLKTNLARVKSEIEQNGPIPTQSPFSPHKHHEYAPSKHSVQPYVQETSSRQLSTLSSRPSTPTEVLRALYETLRQHGVSLILTQMADLWDEASFVESSLLNAEIVVTRIGVLEPQFPALEAALNEFMSRQLPEVTRKDVRVSDPRRKSPNEKITGHIFLIIALEDSLSPLMKPAYANPRQFYAWKRIHFQVIINRGVKSPDQPRGYYWIASEPDDIGEPRLPAESYEAFETRAVPSADAKDGNHSLVNVPKDKKAFLSEKESAEFLECPSHSASVRAKFEGNWRGKKVTDAVAIRKYMTSIMAVKNLLRRYGIRSWLNCGTLLGWYRQCSLIPKDPDIDMLQYSAPEFYPSIHADILRRKNIFKVLKLGVNEDAPGGYQRGFYWKLGVKSGINVDMYFYFGHKLYDMNHKKGDIKYFDFTDKICSADLHGYRVYVLCSYEKNRDLSRVYYGPDIFKPK